MRCGWLGASQVHMAIARTRSGWAASRENIMAQLIVERMTGIPTEGFTSSAMEWGTATEPQARAAYAFAQDVEVQTCSFIRHPRINGTGASPDGLIANDSVQGRYVDGVFTGDIRINMSVGGLEIKCPNTATHIDTLLNGTINGQYITQMNWQMACAGLEWVDFVSFDPRLPGLELWVKRIERDDKAISILEEQVTEFLVELETRMKKLEEMKA